MKTSIFLSLLLIPFLSFAQSLREMGVRGHINIMHLHYVEGGFTTGLIPDGESHPRDLMAEHIAFAESIEHGRVEMNEVLNQLGVQLDVLLRACGHQTSYSACTTLRCQRQTRRLLNNCDAAPASERPSANTLQTVHTQMAELESLSARLNSDEVRTRIALQAFDIPTQALGISMRAGLVTASQVLINPTIMAHIPDGARGNERARLYRESMVNSWADTARLLGCNGGTIDPEFASFQSTPGFMNTACALSEIGMQNGLVTSDDFIQIFEPGVNWSIYENYGRD